MGVVNIFMHHLSMAICEWFLMFLMFFDATLGLILTKFADHCALQTPCLFCFKFDHVFGEKPGYYLNFFCKKHRAEVSCLITCEIHEKLADVREMCDDCMKQNEFSKRFLNKNFVRKPSSLGVCSCCNIQWKPKQKPKPGTRRARTRGPYRGRSNFKRVRDRISGYSSSFYIGDKIHMDNVSDLQFYSGSDSESEDSFYEIDCGETECYEPFFRNGSDKHEESFKFSEIRVEKLDETREREGYESSETRRQGETELNGPHNGSETINGHQNGPDKHEGYEYSETHSVGETDGENSEKKKSNRPDNRSEKPEDYEHSETHSVGETDGEHDVSTLKRKLESEQHRLRLLHKELDEERNASAIAADEAMAMITRLQEEKAALHMEASQYLRMMDEQAEYDMDALDKANDLVSEKDKEIQDLEAELEYFRNRYENELFNNNGNFFKSFKKSKSVLGLEDEKNYILRSLSELERKYQRKSRDSMDLNGESEVDVENEISGLNERVEALESDRDFMEHACNMVESHGGVQFIQEIAQHLRDLRRARFD